MLSEELERKLVSYFGFVKNMKCQTVGIKLEESIKHKDVNLIIILDECSEKNEEKLRRTIPENSDVKIIRYLGKVDVKSEFGFEKLKAIGIKDRNLAKAIYETMEEEMRRIENE